MKYLYEIRDLMAEAYQHLEQKDLDRASATLHEAQSVVKDVLSRVENSWFNNENEVEEA